MESSVLDKDNFDLEDLVLDDFDAAEGVDSGLDLIHDLAHGDLTHGLIHDDSHDDLVHDNAQVHDDLTLG